MELTSPTLKILKHAPEMWLFLEGRIAVVGDVSNCRFFSSL
ncbi:MAG: hypothetical protein ACFE68_09360 [Candidatus Hodarchaeota archaeon]